MNIKQLSELAENLFGKKQRLNSLHQEIAENFYPERADFTVGRDVGEEFAANLYTSYPVTVRRSLGNQFSSMLRPTARTWFHTGIRHKEETQHETKVALEWMETVQRRAMYDPKSKFQRATKEGDHDFAAFGQNVISSELNSRADGILYRCWHLRDVCWQENQDGEIGCVFRKWKPTAQQLKYIFGDKVHEKVKKLCEKTPFEEVKCLHMVVEADMYDDDARGLPRWSIYYDVMHDHIIEATPIWTKYYNIPRWQTVSGSQYAFSPATVAALPDARLIQAMSFTLLEAGEKAVSPPMIATQGAIRSDMGLYAGGVTWVDEEYDEKLGQALRPLEQDLRGLNVGFEMTRDTRALLDNAFFLNTLSMPPAGGPDMTAYEVGQRVQEYIRNALPIFEPMEAEYNAGLCDQTFELLWRNGAFGNPANWPEELQGADIDFSFESPLHDAIQQQKGTKYQEAQALIGEAIALDPSLAALPRSEEALRDALEGIGVPSNWINSEADFAAAKQAMIEAQQQKAQLDALEQASKAASNLGGVPQGVMQ